MMNDMKPMFETRIFNGKKKSGKYSFGAAQRTEIFRFVIDEIKKHWKRDDLIKKAKKYEKKAKFEKAIVQYKKMLEIFPDDGETKNKIEELGLAG